MPQKNAQLVPQLVTWRVVVDKRVSLTLFYQSQLTQQPTQPNQPARVQLELTFLAGRPI